MAKIGMKPVNNGTRFIGRICNKHPHLGGLRLISNRTCLGCHRERWATLSKARAKTAVGLAYANRKREAQINRRKLEKEKVFARYGEGCAICGFNDMRALTIDHIDQKGAKHTQPNGKRYTGPWLYRWLIGNKFPKGFRTLCANCQMIVFKEASK